MSDEPDNIILHILQDMRTELRTVREELREIRAEAIVRDEKTQAQIGVLAEGLGSLRIDMRRMSGHMQEIAMAIDHHTTRLDKIEHHLGLNQAKH